MTDFVQYELPDMTEVLIKHLSPLGEVRDSRPSGSILPFRMVQGHGGTATDFEGQPRCTVHTFAATDEDAQVEAMKTDRRIMILASRFAPKVPVILDDGREVWIDRIKVHESQHKRLYVEDESLIRWMAIYEFEHRIIPVIP